MTGIGTANLVKYQAGKRLTASASIKAKCAQCMDNYVNGKIDCDLPMCPLHPWQPYAKKTNGGK